MAAALAQQWGPGAIALSVDGFHLPGQALRERGIADRKGAPDTYDVPGLLRLLEALRRPDRGEVLAPAYSRDLHEPVADAARVGPDIHTVIVEGNYLGLQQTPWSEVRPLLDLLWYLDIPWAVTRERLIARRVATGRDVVEAREWVTTVDRANDALVRSTTAGVDRVVTAEELR